MLISLSFLVYALCVAFALGLGVGLCIRPRRRRVSGSDLFHGYSRSGHVLPGAWRPNLAIGNELRRVK